MKSTAWVLTIMLKHFMRAKSLSTTHGMSICNASFFYDFLIVCSHIFEHLLRLLCGCGRVQSAQLTRIQVPAIPLLCIPLLGK